MTRCEIGECRAITLTTGLDTLVGTSGNDTFIADNTAKANNQTGAADTINGAAGIDTLKVYLLSTDGIDTLTIPGLTSVENIYLNSGTLSNGKTLDVSGLTGVTGLTLDTPAAMAKDDAFTIKVAAAQTLALTKVKGTDTAGENATVNLDGATVVTLNGVGSTKGTVILDLVSTGTALTLNTATAASKVTLADTGKALTTLTIAGNQNVTVIDTVDSLKTVTVTDTGNVSFDASGATIGVAFAFTGGAGNDTLTLKKGALATLTAGSQLDGGAGTGDTLVLKEDAALTAAQLVSVNAAKGFETLGFGASGASVDISKLTSINQFKVLAGDFTEGFTNALSTSKFSIDNSAGNSGTVTIANKVSEDSTTVSIDVGAAGAAKTFAKLDVTGITKVALSSTGVATKAGGANIITDLINNDSSTITVTGDTNLTITKALLATATGSKIDANAFTGNLSVIGSTKADILIGGTGADTLQGAVADTTSAADSLTGKAGADLFTFAGSTMAKLLLVSGNTTAITSITDFVAGTDKINLVDANTVETSMVLATAQTIATAADLAAVYAGMTKIAASTDNGAMSGVVLTVSAGAAAGTYLYVNDATDTVEAAKDMLINITGITGTLTANDFAFA